MVIIHTKKAMEYFRKSVIRKLTNFSQTFEQKTLRYTSLHLSQ